MKAPAALWLHCLMTALAGGAWFAIGLINARLPEHAERVMDSTFVMYVTTQLVATLLPRFAAPSSKEEDPQ